MRHQIKLLIYLWCLNLLYHSVLLGVDTVAERTTLLNQDFHLYSDEEIKASSHTDKARIDYNIGNLYTQFGEYPWAIYYYEKALKHLPRDLEILHNLAIVKEQMHLPKPRETNLDIIFAFIPSLSQEESWRGMAVCMILVIAIASLYLWMPYRFFKISAWWIGCAGFLLFLYALYLHYFSPLEGIMVHSSYLYRGPGPQYAQVMVPIFSGTKVKVTDITAEGHWLKVETDQGSVGYVPLDSIRVI